MERWSRSGVAFLIVAVLAIGCYLNALGGDFVSDDRKDIVNNPILTDPHRLPELFTTPFLYGGKKRGFYRPITGLTYWVDHRIFGPNPFGFHLENLLWHTATALLILLLLRELWPKEPLMALMGAALFAVHPVHTEAVAWVSGRSEVLAAFWGILAFWAHRRADREGAPVFLWRIAALAAWIVALGAKEMAATVPLLLLMTDALLASPSRWWRPGRLATRYGLYAAVAVAYVALRLSVLGQLGPGPQGPGELFHGAPLSVRGATMLKVAAGYVGRLIFPVNMNHDWSIYPVRGLTDGYMPLLALALLVTLLGLAWAVRRTAPPVSWGILWAGLALLPVSNLLPMGWSVSERILYFSSLGACVALAWVMTRGMKPLKEASPQVPMALAGALGCAVLVLFSVNTIKRNQDWSNDFILWDKTVRQSPNSARAHNNLGMLLARKGRYAEAESLIKRALAIKEKALEPDHPFLARRLNNLAKLYKAQGRYAEAEPLFRRALAIFEKVPGPDRFHLATLYNLAKLYKAQGNYAKVEPLYKRSLAISEKALGPDHPNVAQSLKNLAALYRFQGQYPKAEPLYKRALAIWEKALGPDHPNVGTSLNNLAVVYQAQGRYSDAEPLLKRALAIREKALGTDHPKVASTLRNLAEIYTKMGRDDEAEKLMERAKRIWAKQ